VSLTSDAPSLARRLSALAYEVKAGELVRYQPNVNDDAVGALVRSASLLSVAERRDFRRALGDDESDTLRVFAMRRTLQARRSASLAAIIEALHAFALLPTLDAVPWESWLKASLFIARSQGGDLNLLRRDFADVASDDALARYDVAHESMSRIDELEQCHVVETSTTYGTGLLETLVFRNARTFAAFGAPNRLGDNEVSFRPSTNLAQLAVTLADAFDATLSIVTGPIGQDQLAASLFSLAVAGSYVATSGCLSFVADEERERSSFTAFVAELIDDDAAALALSAIDTNQQWALYDERRLIVLSPQPRFDDHETNTLDLRSFDELARGAFQAPLRAGGSSR
jgi:hypothetical protein